MEDKKEVFKVKASTRFLYAQTGKIYDPGDVFEVKTKEEFNYLTQEHKLCSVAAKEAVITETDQDRRDSLAIDAAKKEIEIKSEVKEVIKDKFPILQPKKKRVKKS